MKLVSSGSVAIVCNSLLANSPEISHLHTEPNITKTSETIFEKEKTVIRRATVKQNKKYL